MNARYYTFFVTDFICLVDRDCSGCRSVTNDTDRIIRDDLAPILAPTKRLVYRGSERRWDEIKLKHDSRPPTFDGVAPLDIKLASTLDVLASAFFGEATDKNLFAMGYERPFKVLKNGRIAAIQTINTWLVAIVVDVRAYGHSDAFYYRSNEAARQALDNWNGIGEPQNWIYAIPKADDDMIAATRDRNTFNHKRSIDGQERRAVAGRDIRGLRVTNGTAKLDCPFSWPSRCP